MPAPHGLAGRDDPTPRRRCDPRLPGELTAGSCRLAPGVARPARARAPSRGGARDRLGLSPGCCSARSRAPAPSSQCDDDRHGSRRRIPRALRMLGITPDRPDVTAGLRSTRRQRRPRVVDGPAHRARFDAARLSLYRTRRCDAVWVIDDTDRPENDAAASRHRRRTGLSSGATTVSALPRSTGIRCSRPRAHRSAALRARHRTCSPVSNRAAAAGRLVPAGGPPRRRSARPARRATRDSATRGTRRSRSAAADPPRCRRG